MSRYSNEALDLDLIREDDMEDARRLQADMERERDVDAQAEAMEAQYVSHMNPLGLIAGDLVAVGWDSDPFGGTWFHCDHGSQSFLGACRIEADRVSPLGVVEDY